ncbi:hypothetical protein BD769DRAFT_1356915, partial [Suillus cothurnatus]
LLNKTGSVVSGSCVLSLVQAERGGTIPKDMDVYITEKYEAEVLNHFKEEEGYECTQEMVTKPEYESSVVYKIHKLVKKNKQVDVIITHWKCAIAPILQFHSTAVMNYITADSIVCLYPRWTTANKSLIHPRMYLENLTHLSMLNALMKYQKRGFHMSAEPFHLGDHVCEEGQDNRKKSGYCPHALRSTVDGEIFRWNFRLTQTLGNTTIMCHDLPIMVWCLGGHECVEGNKDETISFMLVSA